MKVVGIIAEFNPFHNGHKYIIDRAKEVANADYAVIIMSGSYVQRGTPACMGKYERTRTALLCGADAVFELPVSYSTATAETFAYGGVSILNSLGCIDSLAFGSECGDITKLYTLARTLVNPSEEFKMLLQNNLSKGLSYPAARANAIPQYSDILSKPNNILGIEYIKAIIQLSSNITPLTVARIGSDYNDTTLSSFASASGIRNAFESSNSLVSEELDLIKEAVPAEAFDIICENFNHTLPIRISDFDEIIHYSLLSETEENLASYQDMTPDIARRLLNSLNTFTNTEDFVLSNKTKELTYSRIMRGLLHCMLKLPDLTRGEDNKIIPCPYTRLLGFKKVSQPLMHEISTNASIAIVNKAADASKIMNEKAYHVYSENIKADRIYDSVVAKKYGTRPIDGCLISPVII